MAEKTNQKQHLQKGFSDVWHPHRVADDFWSVAGVVREKAFPETAYGFHICLQQIFTGYSSVFLLSSGVDDCQGGIAHRNSCGVPLYKAEKSGLMLDENSIIHLEHTQIMMEPDAFALRITDGDMRLDLRMEITRPTVWYNSKGRLPIGSLNDSGSLQQCLLPDLFCIGKFYNGEQELPVEGQAVFERMWGRYPIRKAKAHWECFHLFFDNGDEAMVRVFPLQEAHAGCCQIIRKSDEAFVPDAFTLEVTGYTEVDEWRFGSSWRLSIPDYLEEPCYLTPAIEGSFGLPAGHPLLRICNENGEHCGYAIGELMPGARNELDRVSLRFFCKELNKPKDGTKEEISSAEGEMSDLSCAAADEAVADERAANEALLAETEESAEIADAEVTAEIADAEENPETVESSEISGIEEIIETAADAAEAE